MKIINLKNDLNPTGHLWEVLDHRISTKNFKSESFRSSNNKFMLSRRCPTMIEAKGYVTK